MEGLGWRVGNGWSIKVQDEKWVCVDGRLTSPTRLNNDGCDMQVGELIHHDTMV